MNIKKPAQPAPVIKDSNKGTLTLQPTVAAVVARLSDGRLIIIHNEFRPHVWDGKIMRALTEAEMDAEVINIPTKITYQGKN